MLELEFLGHNLLLLLISTVVPIAMYRLNYRGYIATLSLTAVLSYFMFQAQSESLRSSNHNLKAFEELQLSRGFNSAEYRQVKKAIFSKYHPDKATNEIERGQLLLTFQKMEGYLSLIDNSNRRELFDKFNITTLPQGADSDILFELKTNFVKNAAITTLPRIYGWLLGVTLLMFLSRPDDFKMLLNILIGKSLFNVYYLVIKNVQEKDLIDYVLPYMTIFERIVLSDHLFTVIFSAVVLYVLRSRDQKPLTVDLSSFFSRANKAKVSKEAISKLEGYAKSLNIFQSQKVD